MSRAGYFGKVGRWLLALLISFFATTGVLSAHEIRPAYLQIDQVGHNRFSVLWRTPILAGMRLPVLLKFSDGIRTVTGPLERELSDSVVEPVEDEDEPDEGVVLEPFVVYRAKVR